MSHVSCIDVVVKDLDALKQVAKELGLEFRENQRTWQWYGRDVGDYHEKDAAYRHGINQKDYGKCTHALSIPGDKTAYEVGIVQMPDGSYKCLWDFYGHLGQKMSNKIGSKGELLLQGYAKEVAIKALAKKGLKVVKTEKLSNGKLKVTLRG